MKKRVKIISSLVIALALATTFIAAAGAPLQAPVHTVTPGEAVVSFTEEGRVTYEQVFDIYPVLDGEVLEVLVQEGDKVSAGDPLLVISADNVAYQIQMLQSDIAGYQAQIHNLNLQEQKEKESLASTREELAGQKTTVEAQAKMEQNNETIREEQARLQERIIDQNRSNVSLARNDADDARKDYKDDDMTEMEYNTYRSSLNDSRNALTTSEMELLNLQNGKVEEGYYEGQLDSLQAQIDYIDGRTDKNYSTGMQSYYNAQIASAQTSIQQLQDQQGKATVTAPCDGYVSALPAQGLSMVTRGNVVVQIGANPVVEVNVPVRELDGIAVGNTTTLTVQKRMEDTVCSGTIMHMDTQAKVSLSALGVEESVLRVLIQPDAGCLLVGFQVDVDFITYREENCITVPKKAIFQQDGGDFVWIVRNGDAAIVPVTAGAETLQGTIILEGLADGDIVVAQANTEGLAEGKRIAI